MDRYRRENIGGYVLISLYNRGSLVDPQWEVYGHVSPGINDLIHGDFKTKSEAMEYAHSLPWTIPVMIAQGAYTEITVEKLSQKGRRE